MNTNRRMKSDSRRDERLSHGMAMRSLKQVMGRGPGLFHKEAQIRVLLISAPYPQWLGV